MPDVSKLFFPPIHPAHFTSTAGVEAGMGQYCAIAEKVLKKPTTTNSAMVRITLTLSPLSSDDGDERPSFFDSNWSGQPTTGPNYFNLDERLPQQKKRAGISPAR